MLQQQPRHAVAGAPVVGRGRGPGSLRRSGFHNTSVRYFPEPATKVSLTGTGRSTGVGRVPGSPHRRPARWPAAGAGPAVAGGPPTLGSVPVSSAVVRRVALANAVANGLIVVTGGAVRLTGSGLGCPTWPECTDGSITPTAGARRPRPGRVRQPAADLRGRRHRDRHRRRGVALGPARAAALGGGQLPGHPRAGPARRGHRAHRPEPVDRRRALPAVDGAGGRGDHAVAALPGARRGSAAGAPADRPAGHRDRRRGGRRPGARHRRHRLRPAQRRPRPPGAPASTPSWSASCTPTWSSCSSG